MGQHSFPPPYAEPDCAEHAAIIRAMINADTMMSKAQRALMHEYGFTIVAAMIDTGARNPVTLALDLETWRARRQQRWLQTDYIDDKVRSAVLNVTRRRMPRALRPRSTRQTRADFARRARANW